MHKDIFMNINYEHPNEHPNEHSVEYPLKTSQWTYVWTFDRTSILNIHKDIFMNIRLELHYEHPLRHFLNIRMNICDEHALRHFYDHPNEHSLENEHACDNASWTCTWTFTWPGMCTFCWTFPHLQLGNTSGARKADKNVSRQLAQLFERWVRHHNKLHVDEAISCSKEEQALIDLSLTPGQVPRRTQRSGPAASVGERSSSAEKNENIPVKLYDARANYRTRYFTLTELFEEVCNELEWVVSAAKAYVGNGVDTTVNRYAEFMSNYSHQRVFTNLGHKLNKLKDVDYRKIDKLVSGKWQCECEVLLHFYEHPHEHPTSLWTSTWASA